MRTSKHILAGVGIAAIATALVSFSGEGSTIKKDDDKKKKYHVIHQKDGEMVEYDTIIPMSSNYSVQDFLADKGIDDPEAKIIKVPSMGNAVFMSEGGEDTKVFMHRMDEDILIEDENGTHKEVKIIREEDENGNVIMKKYVNGEEVEVTEEDMKHIHHHGHGEHHKIIIKEGGDDLKWVEKEGSENVELKVEVDEEGNMKVQKFVNGEEVEVSEEEMEKIHSGSHMQHNVFIMDGGDSDIEWTPADGEQNVELKVEMDEEGNMKVQKFVNGEEVEVSEEEMQKIHDGHGQRIMIVHGDQEGDLNIDMDSIMQAIEMEIEVIDEEGMQDGQQRIIVKELHVDGEESSDDKKEIRKEIRMQHHMEVDGEGEDFTVVLVHENYDEAMEAHMQVRTMVVDEKEDASSDRELSLNEPISVYPNPNNGTFTIAFNQKNEAKTAIRVVDAQGKVVYKEKLGDFSGSYKKELDLKKHGVGTYIVTVQQGGETSSRKVIVE